MNKVQRETKMNEKRLKRLGNQEMEALDRLKNTTMQHEFVQSRFKHAFGPALSISTNFGAHSFRSLKQLKEIEKEREKKNDLTESKDENDDEEPDSLYMTLDQTNKNSNTHKNTPRMKKKIRRKKNKSKLYYQIFNPIENLKFVRKLLMLNLIKNQLKRKRKV